MTLTFMEAVTKLRLAPTSEELRPIIRKASAWFPGKLRQMFVVLPDENADTLSFLSEEQF
jgi:hypothetical protein